VRRQRRDYLAGEMNFDLLRNVTADEVRERYSRQGATRLPLYTGRREKLDLRPGSQATNNSTLVCRSVEPPALDPTTATPTTSPSRTARRSGRTRATSATRSQSSSSSTSASTSISTRRAGPGARARPRAPSRLIQCGSGSRAVVLTSRKRATAAPERPVISGSPRPRQLSR
jgi:hypothetical protein